MATTIHHRAIHLSELLVANLYYLQQISYKVIQLQKRPHANTADAPQVLLIDIYKTNPRRTQHRRVPKQTHNIRTQCFHVANKNSVTSRHQKEQRNCRFSIIFILSLQIASKKIHPHQLSSSSHYNKTTLVKNSNHLLLANFQSCEFVMGIYSSCGSTNSTTSQKPKQDQQ